MNSLHRQPPKVKSIYTHRNNIYVTFENDVSKKYRIHYKMNHPFYEKLKDHSFLKTAKIDSGGYAISWNDDVDISEHELWTNGKVLKPQIIQLLYRGIRQ